MSDLSEYSSSSFDSYDDYFKIHKFKVKEL